MPMESHYFPGQQTDERVLYIVEPHIYALYTGLAKIYLLSLAIFLSFLFLTSVMKGLPFIGLFLGSLIAVFGTWASVLMFKKSRAYITDRRIVRFEAATPFATNSRALNWDDAVKIKTFPRNALWNKRAKTCTRMTILIWNTCTTTKIWGIISIRSCTSLNTSPKILLR